MARSNAAVAEAAAALRGQAEGAVQLQRELAATSHWGAALLLASVLRCRMRQLCTDALRSWYAAAPSPHRRRTVAALTLTPT